MEGLKAYLNVGNPQWAMRRRLVVLILFFCIGIICYCMYKADMNEARAEMLIGQSFMTIMVVLNGYIFGAVVDSRGNATPAAQQFVPQGFGAVSQQSTSTATVEQTTTVKRIETDDGDDGKDDTPPPEARPLGSK